MKTQPNDFLLNITDAVSWRNRWWLLDLETGGLDRRKDDIIALRLARIEDGNVTREREILVRPRRPLRPWAEGVTGISNRELKQATPLEGALARLEELDGPLLFLDRGFTLPFLQNAYLRCGREFSRPCLLLDRLAALLLGGSPGQRTDKFLEQLLPPDGVQIPPQNRHLKKPHALSLALFHALEETYRIHNTAELAAPAADWLWRGLSQARPIKQREARKPSFT